MLERVILLPLLHIIMQFASLGKHALDTRRGGWAAEELTRHLGQVRQASWAATCWVRRFVVVACLPPRKHIKVVVFLDGEQ